MLAEAEGLARLARAEAAVDRDVEPPLLPVAELLRHEDLDVASLTEPRLRMACRHGSPALLEPSRKPSTVKARIMSTTRMAGRSPKPARAHVAL